MRVTRRLSLYKLLPRGVGEDDTPFPGLLHFTIDMYLILLNVKQGGIKYHFKSLWYDVTWDWTQVCRIIGEYSTHRANELVYIYIYIYKKQKLSSKN